MKHRPRRRFAQHFLIAPEVVDGMIAAIAPRPGDVIVEIGPGRGALTDPLAGFDIQLHAIEFDRDLVAGLRARFSAIGKVTIHEADALEFDYSSIGGSIRIVGNLPYNISTPLLFHLVRYRSQIRDLHFMLQKEVVDRMVATPGGKDYGRLTIMLGSYMEMLPLFEVPPTAFSPPPKVNSAIVRMRPLAADHYEIADAGRLSGVVSAAFSKRRKTLHNALKGVADDKLLRSAGMDPDLRPEQIPVARWIQLANLLTG